jgi:nucleotide-binding universal stress UspA family protein
MIKTILVPTSGSDTDDIVFETAISVARPCNAHLEFCHVVIDPSEALHNSLHARSARGQALKNFFEAAAQEAAKRQTAASTHVKEFCAREQIPMADAPPADGMFSASWRQGASPVEQFLTARARHSDLVVVGRSTRPNGLPLDLLPRLLRGCGRPMVIAGSKSPKSPLATIMVCWNETPEAARAMSAALPLLARARKVEIVTADEGEMGCAETVNDVACQLAWHGIRASTRTVSLEGRSPAEALVSVANECGADLVVMGGFRRGSVKKTLFGGCTEAVLRNAKRPVFVVH